MPLVRMFIAPCTCTWRLALLSAGMQAQTITGIPPASYMVPVDASARYDDIPIFAGFEDQVQDMCWAGRSP